MLGFQTRTNIDFNDNNNLSCNLFASIGLHFSLSVKSIDDQCIEQCSGLESMRRGDVITKVCEFYYSLSKHFSTLRVSFIGQLIPQIEVDYDAGQCNLCLFNYFHHT